MADRQEPHDGAKMKKCQLFAHRIEFLFVFLRNTQLFEASVLEKHVWQIDARCGKVRLRSTCVAHLGGLSSEFGDSLTLFKDEATIFLFFDAKTAKSVSAPFIVESQKTLFFDASVQEKHE